MARVREKELNGKEDHRHYKQPMELKSPNELLIMTEQEKFMYIQKLRTEVQEYETLESTYKEKREELLQIEKAFRDVNGRIVEDNSKVKYKDSTNTYVIDGLKD